MKHPALAVWLLSVVCLLAMVTDGRAHGHTFDEGYGGAVVRIDVFPTTGTTSIKLGSGTGWLVSFNGFVITATHVVTADGDKPWGATRPMGWMWDGHTHTAEPLEFVADLGGDVTLLRFNWPAGRRAERIFPRISAQLPTERTEILVFGFPIAQPKPSIYRHNVVYSGARLGGDGKLPHGVSGAPVIWSGTQYFDVIGMARAVAKNSHGADVEAEYVIGKPLEAAFDVLERRPDAVLSLAKPLWLPPTAGPSLFRDALLDELTAALVAGKSAFVSGGPGTDLDEVAIAVGGRIWERRQTRDSYLVYVDVSKSDDDNAALRELVLRLRRGHLSEALYDVKVAGIRDLLERPGRVVIVHGVKSEKLARDLLAIRGKTPLLIASPRELAVDGFDVTRRLGGLDEKTCVELVRAEAARADVKPNPDLAEVCRALGGLPEAARGVGALMRGSHGRPGLSTKDIVKAVLHDPLGVVPERIHALYETLLKTLPARDQQLALALSAIGGDTFDSEAASAVAGRPTAVYLHRLVAANLVEAVEDRYRLPTLTRVYLLEKLRTAPEAYARAHAEMSNYYLEAPARSLHEARREWSNVEHALKTVEESLKGEERRQRLATSLPGIVRTLRAWGRWTEHARWAKVWLGSVDDKDTTARLAALSALAEGAVEQAQDSEARAFAEDALKVPGAATNPAAATAYAALARLEIEPTEWDKTADPARVARARAFLDRYVELGRKSPDAAIRAEVEAAGWRRYGILYELERRLDEARAAYGKSLAAAAGPALQRDRIRTIYHLASLAMRAKEWDEAARQFRLVVKEAARVDESARSNALVMLGHVARHQGNLFAAEYFLEEALRSFEGTGARRADEVKKALEEVRQERVGDG